MRPSPSPPGRPALRLGEAANLLLGLRARWRADGGARPFFAPPGEPLETFPPEGPAAPDEGWSEPVVSLHARVDDLLDALFEHRVLPFPGDPSSFCPPPSALLRVDEERRRPLEELGRFLGLDLAAGGGFLLLETRRRTDERVHEVAAGGVGRRIRIERHWTAAGRAAMARLRVAEKGRIGTDLQVAVSARHARRYLAYFDRFGTHFVARLALGDRLVQVLACRSDRLRLLERLFEREAGGRRAAGPLALGLAEAAGPEWVAARGRIVCQSGDPALGATLEEGRWDEPTVDGGPSLFGPWRRDPAAHAPDGFLARRFRRVVPLGVALAPQSPMMERFRAAAFQQILQGALLQRYTGAARISVRRSSGAGAAPAADGPFAPVPVRPETLVLGAALDREDLAAGEDGEVARWTAHCLHLDLAGPSPVRLPGRRVVLTAYRTVAGVGGGEIPVVELEDEAFGSYEVATRRMDGAFAVRDRSGRRRETIAAGLRFATEAADDGARVVVREDLRRPSAACLEELAGVLGGTLDLAEAMLTAPAATLAETAPLATGYLEWLLEILPAEGAPARLRRRVLGLARAPAGPPPPAETPLLPDERAGLTEAAAEVERLAVEMRRELAARRTRGRLPGRGVDDDRRLHAELSAALGRAGDRLEEVAAAVAARETAGAEGAEEGAAGASGDDPAALALQAWRVLRLLALLLRRVENALEPAGTVGLDPPETLGLAPLARALGERLRRLERRPPGAGREPEPDQAPARAPGAPRTNDT